jgi:mRNA-degrading endonuclease RelE of RelBE toxin-antitoxin system
MSDKIKKILAKLSPKERETIQLLILRIKLNDTVDLDIKHLKDHNNLFRVKKGSIRIVYERNKTNIKVIRIDRCNEKTCKDL